MGWLKAKNCSQEGGGIEGVGVQEKKPWSKGLRKDSFVLLYSNLSLTITKANKVKLAMGISIEIWRCRIGGFNALWTNMAARVWKVETGRTSCKMSGMKFVFLLLIILSNDVETNPWPGPNTRGKQTTMEESQPQNPSGRKLPIGISGLLSEIHKLGKLYQLDNDFQSQMNNT